MELPCLLRFWLCLCGWVGRRGSRRFKIHCRYPTDTTPHVTCNFINYARGLFDQIRAEVETKREGVQTVCAYTRRLTCVCGGEGGTSKSDGVDRSCIPATSQKEQSPLHQEKGRWGGGGGGLQSFLPRSFP